MSESNPQILVIGAGVVGLTTALYARGRGYQVKIVAEAFAPDITSVVAGALWEWPPAVCGQHRDELSIERSKAWCMDSYQRFWSLAEDPSTGVHVRPVVFYFRRPVAADAAAFAKMRELRYRVRGFRHDADLIIENGVSPSAGVRDAYAYQAPMIDTDLYMAWLLRQVREAGCDLEQRRIDGPLLAQEADLLREHRADAIVNCTGLGSAGLTDDAMYPLRGALIYAHNDGVTMPKITSAHCMSFDDSIGGQNMVFIVPRGEDKVVLGGLVEPGEWSTDLTMDNYPPLRDMLRRCQEFLPALEKATIFEEGTVRVGLRPSRMQGVRLEHEPGTRIVHNVGHGGSGVTFSWGCAAETVQRLDDLLG